MRLVLTAGEGEAETALFSLFLREEEEGGEEEELPSSSKGLSSKWEVPLPSALALAEFTPP
jgi:hypothetical protein